MASAGCTCILQQGGPRYLSVIEMLARAREISRGIFMEIKNLRLNSR